jgi:hypothetical protein
MFVENKQELELIILKEDYALLLSANFITYKTWKGFLYGKHGKYGSKIAILS